MTNTVIQEWKDEKGWIHRIEIPLMTFLTEHNLELVVRCKDCRKWCICHKSDDFYCADGERREE